jgi:uncharacterized protein
VLTADLVRARARGGQLELLGLRGAARAKALEVCAELLDQARACVGHTQGELRALWATGDAGQDGKLRAGLCKLILDGSSFEQDTGVEPEALRAKLFLEAASVRRGLSDGARLDRAGLMARLAEKEGLTPERLEQALFCDLASEQRVLEVPSWGAPLLLDLYESAQVQAVLLRATRIVVDVQFSRPEDYRRIFQKLKFRRLLFRLSRGETGYRLEIDGPHSLFDAVTKYGLQMALVLPELLQAKRLELRADLRWGKARAPLNFTLNRRSSADVNAELPALGQTAGDEASERAEVTALLSAFAEGRRLWRATAADRLLELPGGGILVPDLLFRHADGTEVFLEVLGYWSRDAVWARIDWVRAGLPFRVVFAVSSRLRVSEAALESGLGGALYVFKGSPSAKALEDRLERARLGVLVSEDGLWRPDLAAAATDDSD